MSSIVFRQPKIGKLRKKVADFFTYSLFSIHYSLEKGLHAWVWRPFLLIRIKKKSLVLMARSCYNASKYIQVCNPKGKSHANQTMKEVLLYGTAKPEYMVLGKQ